MLRSPPCQGPLTAEKGRAVTNPELNAQIKAALLESPSVGQVHTVRSFQVAGAEFVGVRVSLVGVTVATDIMPVIATLRARIREIVPTAVIFIEPDVNAERSFDLSTEAIVIRSLD